jgi:exonuclease III
MQLRFISWNQNGFAATGQAAFLARHDWDVCAVQESTTEEALAAFAAEVGAGSHVSARALLAEGAEPRYVSALLARAPWQVAGGATLAVPSPERVVHADATRGDISVAVASLALPPASSPDWGPARKVEQARGIAAWLRAHAGPVVVGIDGNTPKVDHPDLAKSVWWNDGEQELLGAERRHGLRDVYRAVLARDPERARARVREAPEGPLAVSYRRGHGDAAVDCRYDSILASLHFEVVDAAYDYDGAVRAGSDHALVAATLELRG